MPEALASNAIFLNYACERQDETNASTEGALKRSGHLAELHIGIGNNSNGLAYLMAACCEAQMYPHLQKRFAIASLLCLLAGWAILVYKGPGWVGLRYYGGDVVAVAFLYFTLSSVWKASIAVRGGVVAAIAVAIELAQMLHLTPQDGSLLTEILWGSSFDVWDLVAYAMGLAIAIVIDLWLSSAPDS